MEHHLSFLPGPQTPPRCRFAVETLHPRSDSETYQHVCFQGATSVGLCFRECFRLPDRAVSFLRKSIHNGGCFSIRMVPLTWVSGVELWHCVFPVSGGRCSGYQWLVVHGWRPVRRVTWPKPSRTHSTSTKPAFGASCPTWHLIGRCLRGSSLWLTVREPRFNHTLTDTCDHVCTSISYLYRKEQTCSLAEAFF